MLTDNDLIKVQEMSRGLEKKVLLSPIPTAEPDRFEEALFTVARQIAGVASPKIDLDTPESLSPALFPGKPCIVVSADGRSNIYYYAIPQGAELQPFLDAILWVGTDQGPPDSQELETVRNVTVASDLLILMASQCPHCPAVVRTGVGIAAVQPLIKLTVADAVQFADLAERYKVRATPTVIVNDGATLVGQVTEAEMVKHLASVAESSNLEEVVRTMLETGRAEDAARLICEQRRPDALLPMYLAEEFAPRMAALVTFDEALEIDPRALDTIVPDLTALLSHEDVGLRGDSAELLGKIGSEQAVPALEKAAQDEDPDVREAAQEALDAIRSA